MARENNNKVDNTANPTTEYNSIMAQCPPVYFTGEVMASLAEDYNSIIKQLYPNDYCILSCIFEKESSSGKNLYGDNGKAFGSFQIHYEINQVKKECSMDFVCSLKWTASEIKKGNSWKWTSYKPCSKQCYENKI